MITKIHSGVIYFSPTLTRDLRGCSATVWGKINLPIVFKEQYISFSHEGVLRGLHMQPRQGKLVRVLSGEVQDVIVDIKTGTFLDRVMNPLDSVWIPPGFAHGFLALKTSLLEYFYTTPYEEDKVHTFAWNSPKFTIPWILQEGEVPILSDKDAQGTYMERI